MYRFWYSILACLCINVYGAIEVDTILPFNEAAFQDMQQGNAGQALCLVSGKEMLVSGVLFSRDGRVAVLTSAHLPNPQLVYFAGFNRNVNPPAQFPLKYSVVKAIPMEADLKRLTQQTDLQVLLLDGNPQEHIRPFQLSSAIDPTHPLTIYGLGTICAEFTPGHLKVGIPAKNRAPLPSKVIIPNYTVDPKASTLDHLYIGFITLCHKLGMFGINILPQINPHSQRNEGLIYATTHYDPNSLQTHIGEGFSGGPALQGENVVGISQGSKLNFERRTSSQTIGTQGILASAMWTCYFLGKKLPILQSIAPWLYDPFISPSLRFSLERFGVTWLSSPLRMCVFNSGVALLLMVGNTAYAAYRNSQYALKKSKAALFVRITPEVINWIEGVMRSESAHVQTAS